MNFLEQIAADLARQYPRPDALRRHCLVFPTKRAGVYFRKYLVQQYQQQHGKKYLFSPQVWNIVEFTEQLSETVILDTVPLVLELYKTYKQIEPEVRFDNFYAWGKLILSDFDEIDRYMVHATDLFANLKELRNLEEAFSLPPDQLPYLQQFWRVLQKENSTDLEREFIKVWQVLGQVYEAFSQTLLAQNAAYMGMAQRRIVQDLERDILPLPYDHFVFAGFNDLTATEQRIIDCLSSRQQATIYWDTDRFYMDDTPETDTSKAPNDNSTDNTSNNTGELPHKHRRNKHEAGNFLRRYYRQYAQHPAHKWHTQSNWLQNRQQIHLVGTPLQVGQAKYAGQVIAQSLAQNDIDLQDTALVLGDEALLFPMLYALPPNIETVNVTMGYPLRHTPAYQLLETLVMLQKTRKDRPITAKEDDHNKPDSPSSDAAQAIQSVYYSKFVLQTLNNPYIKIYDRDGVETYMSQAERNNWIYAKAETICSRLSHPIFQLLFQPCATFIDLSRQLSDVLLQLFNDLQAKSGLNDDPNDKPDEYEYTTAQTELLPEPDADKFQKQAKPPLELAFLYHTLLQVRKLEDALRRHRHTVSVDTYWKILREIIQSTQLPFEGEPLHGLQILDFLEARSLDFKNIFILGMNEGLIPASRPTATFIPVNLRRAFGMPTFLDQDAIYGYHFYRLLQRAEKVWLVYNTEAGSTGGEERSRYLLQLLYELNANNAPHITLSHHTATAPLSVHTPRTEPLTIAKQGDIIAVLDRYVGNHPQWQHFDHEADDALHNALKQRSLSPSALTRYLTCPIQFYYEYVAQLKETGNIDEDINHQIFGNVLHRCLELIYQPYQRYPVTAATIDKILAKPDDIARKLDRAFRDEKFEVPKEGRNLLLKRVLLRLIQQILETDKADTPFNIIGLEAQEYKTELSLADGRSILLSGTIDRIDQITYAADNLPVYRILDYKTGMVKIVESSKTMSKPDSYFAPYFNNPDYKAGFQAYMYAYLFWTNHQRNARVVAGIYNLRQIARGITYLRNGELIYPDFFEQFEQQLRTVLTTLFDYEQPFIQHNDEKRYDYSPYKKLVHL
ncbi:MAG: PD-(D/E)XK nuclease family protein [Chitinophagales bacterium]|nr:PD-(D/E)XK nuclease family protein [Chitinophagales bacterium]